MKVTVYNEASWLCPLPKYLLQELLCVMYACADDGQESSLVLHVVRDVSIAQYNAEHMCSAGPTNILSFPAAPTSKSMRHMNSPDILILSVDALRRECLLYGQAFEEHTVRLLAHGLGHVLGYDHGEEMWDLCAQMERAGLVFLCGKM